MTSRIISVFEEDEVEEGKEEDKDPVKKEESFVLKVPKRSPVKVIEVSESVGRDV